MDVSQEAEYDLKSIHSTMRQSSVFHPSIELKCWMTYELIKWILLFMDAIQPGGRVWSLIHTSSLQAEFRLQSNHPAQVLNELWINKMNLTFHGCHPDFDLNPSSQPWGRVPSSFQPSSSSVEWILNNQNEFNFLWMPSSQEVEFNH